MVFNSNQFCSGMSSSKCAPTTRIFWIYWVQTWDCNQSETYLWYPYKIPASENPSELYVAFPHTVNFFWVFLCSLTVHFSLGFHLTRNILCSLSVPTIIYVFPSLSVLINVIVTHRNNATNILVKIHFACTLPHLQMKRENVNLLIAMPRTHNPYMNVIFKTHLILNKETID